MTTIATPSKIICSCAQYIRLNDDDSEMLQNK